MKILFIGDIVGRPGRNAVEKLLPVLEQEKGPFDFVIANGENAAGGVGLTPKVVEQLFDAGIHLLTTGNHVWDKKEIIEYIKTEPRILRPANYPRGIPGNGWILIETVSGMKIGVLNVSGQVFMGNYDNPFSTTAELLPLLQAETNLIFYDFHAEATAEKIAMGWFVDGQVSAIVGTHTHVQTADERILPQGTAYITDVGMTGPHDSVIGMQKESVLKKFLTMMPSRHEVAKKDVWLCAVVIDIDASSGRAVAIQRVRMPLSEVFMESALEDGEE